MNGLINYSLYIIGWMKIAHINIYVQLFSLSHPFISLSVHRKGMQMNTQQFCEIRCVTVLLKRFHFISTNRYSFSSIQYTNSNTFHVHICCMPIDFCVFLIRNSNDRSSIRRCTVCSLDCNLYTGSCNRNGQLTFFHLLSIHSHLSN